MLRVVGKLNLDKPQLSHLSKQSNPKQVLLFAFCYTVQSVQCYFPAGNYMFRVNNKNTV